MGAFTQLDHHQKLTFEAESVTLLNRYEIEYDSRFLFEEESHG